MQAGFMAAMLPPMPRVASPLLTVALLAPLACKGGGAKEQVKAEYGQSLPELLDMVGESPEGYMAVRDLTPFWELAKQTKGTVDGPVDKLLGMAEKAGEKVDREDFEEFRGQYSKLMAALENSGIDWSGGLIINGEKAKGGVILFKAESVEKLVPIAEAVDEPATSVTEHCAKLDADPAWIACGKSVEEAKAFKPAKKGAELVAALEHDLPGVDFKGVNVAFDFEEASMVMSTDPGLYHVAVHPKKELPPEFSKVVGGGKAKALRLVQPGDTFLWAQVDMAGAKAQSGGVPAPAKAMVDAFDGEFLMAGIQEPPALLVQVGVSDPYPVRSVLDLGWTQKDNIPKDIPELGGVSFELEANEIEAAGEKFRVLSAIFSGGEIEEMKKFWEPAVSAWVGGGYLSGSVGVTSEGAKKIANASGEGPSKELLASLPPGMAAELSAGEVFFAYHANLDGLHSPALMKELEAEWSKVELPDKPSIEMVKGVMQLFAPYSEISAWGARANTSPVFHIAVRTFGDARTEEGKAALAAIESVYSGTSPADAYGPLAKKYGGSHRAYSYKARSSDELGAAALSGVGVVGIAAAIAVPAFTKYQRRSEEALMEAEMQRMEAERALMEAQLEEAKIDPSGALVPQDPGLGGQPIEPVEPPSQRP